MCAAVTFAGKRTHPDECLENTWLLPKRSRPSQEAQLVRAMDAYVHKLLTPAVCEKADRRFVIWTAVNFRPDNIFLHDLRFMLLVGNLAPDYTSCVIRASSRLASTC